MNPEHYNLFHDGKFEEAIEAATQVIKESNVEIQDNKAVHCKGDIHVEIQGNKTVHWKGDIHLIASAYFYRGLSYKALKHYEKGIEDFEILKILETANFIDKEVFEERISLYLYLHLVGLYLLNNNLDKAIEAETDFSVLLQSRFNNQYNDKLNKLEGLEKIYEEKLKLSAPAKYFEDKGEKYNKKSRTFFWCFVGSILGFIVWLVIAIYFDLFKTSLVQWHTLIPYLSVSALWVFLMFFFRSIYLQNIFLAEEMKQKHTLLYTYLAFIKEQGENKELQSDLLKAVFNISRFKASKNFDLKELMSLLSAFKK